MMIRASDISEIPVLQAVHRDAFGEPEGETIAQLVSDILRDSSAQPLLSIVAEMKETIVGHVIFTAVTISGAEHLSARILAPLAVRSAYQHRGIGTELVRHGLRQLKSCGADAVFVLGNPKYYGRFGFHAGHSIKAPYHLDYPEAWMALELTSGSLSGLSGTAKCCSSLMVPELW